MKKIISWLWGLVPAPAKMWVIVAAVVLALGGVSFVVYKIQDWGYDRRTDEIEDAVIEMIHEKIEVKRKQDEIYNSAVDDSVTIRRLLKHSF